MASIPGPHKHLKVRAQLVYNRQMPENIIGYLSFGKISQVVILQLVDKKTKDKMKYCACTWWLQKNLQLGQDASFADKNNEEEESPVQNFLKIFI